MTNVSQPETAQIVVRAAQKPAADCRLVVISMNPRAGSRWRRQQVAEFESTLISAGFRVHLTGDLVELAAFTASTVPDGLVRAVVAVGGDGTAACVRRNVPLSVPIVPVPTGTENLLARYLNQTATATAVLATLEDGVMIELDLGRANGVPFLLMASVGFDAEVIRLLHESRQGNITRATYLKPTLQAIRSYSYPELRLYCGGSGPESSDCVACRWLFGFNLPLYALGWQLAPQASGADGLLDVCTFERGSLPAAARYLWHVLRGSHLRLGHAHLNRCRQFRVEAIGEVDVAYQIDGDFGGVLPLEVDVLPGELRLLVSRDTAVKLGFAVV